MFNSTFCFSNFFHYLRTISKLNSAKTDRLGTPKYEGKTPLRASFSGAASCVFFIIVQVAQRIELVLTEAERHKNHPSVKKQSASSQNR